MSRHTKVDATLLSLLVAPFRGLGVGRNGIVRYDFLLLFPLHSTPNPSCVLPQTPKGAYCIQLIAISKAYFDNLEILILLVVEFSYR